MSDDYILYAIGDVHGEADKLARLHDVILNDATRAGVRPRIAHLGDYVDRGPDSRAVIARVMALAESAEAPALLGNHEAMMLAAYDKAKLSSEEHWSVNGGEETIASYTRANGAHANWRDAIDHEHIDWMRTLPTIWRDEARRIALVHGGIDPQTFPNCDDYVRLWTRSTKFFDTKAWPPREELSGLLVVHGHTPTDDFEPYVSARRINVDTGACYGGPLTCLVLAPDGEPVRFLQT